MTALCESHMEWFEGHPIRVANPGGGISHEYCPDCWAKRLAGEPEPKRRSCARCRLNQENCCWRGGAGWICSACQRYLPPGWRICGACGGKGIYGRRTATLDQLKAGMRNCPACGGKGRVKGE